LWYEWDEQKNLANVAKHGVRFETADAFAWSTAMEGSDSRSDYGEVRMVALGLIGTRLHVLVYTRRLDFIRVISLRKANERERRAYEAKQGET